MRIKEEGKGLRAEAGKLDNLNGFLYASVLLYEPTAAEVIDSAAIGAALEGVARWAIFSVSASRIIPD